MPKRSFDLAQQLVRDLQEENVAPGATLPPEHVMLARYGVARSSLREALRILEVHGAVRMRTGRNGGPIFTVPELTNLASHFGLYLTLHDVKFRDVVLARRDLEPILARGAARHGQDVAATLLDSVEAIRNAPDHESIWRTENYRFHSTVAVAADNAVLSAVLAGLKNLSDGVILGVKYSARNRLAIADAHERIATAIRDGNPELAQKEMDAHMADYYAFLNRVFPDILEASVQWRLNNH